MDIRHVVLLSALPVLAAEWVDIFRQDKCECAMDIRHAAVFLQIQVLPREWVQDRPSRLVWMCNGYKVIWQYFWHYGSGPACEFSSTVKTRVIVKWIYGMPPYCWLSGYCTVSEWTSSVKTSVNLQMVYGMLPYCWHYWYCTLNDIER